MTSGGGIPVDVLSAWKSQRTDGTPRLEWSIGVTSSGEVMLRFVLEIEQKCIYSIIVWVEFVVNEPLRLKFDVTTGVFVPREADLIAVGNGIDQASGLDGASWWKTWSNLGLGTRVYQSFRTSNRTKIALRRVDLDLV